MRINGVNESIESTHCLAQRKYMLAVDVLFDCSIISNICHTHPRMTQYIHSIHRVKFVIVYYPHTNLLIE